jgi:excisionase family DNA binding protein
MGKIVIDPDDWITLAEAARLRNTSRQAISNLVKRGRLETIRIAGHIFVKKSSVLSFVESSPGRKAKREL